jgi:hypothetical protein
MVDSTKMSRLWRWAYNAQGFVNGFEFKIQVFARDAEPVEWLIAFTEAEVKTVCEKGGKYRSLAFPL